MAVSTWIEDFRRVTSRRAYEFRLADTGELAAKAYTDWVFLDTTNNIPTSIPRSLVDDFFPEGAPEHYYPRKPFPAPSTTPPGKFTIRRRVSWGDIDSMQHVNNAVYMDYTNECGYQIYAASNWPWKRMVDHGFSIKLHQAHLQYLQPAVLDDELEVTTWITSFRRASAPTRRRADATATGPQ